MPLDTREVSMPTHTTTHRVERTATPMKVIRHGERILPASSPSRLCNPPQTYTNRIPASSTYSGKVTTRITSCGPEVTTRVTESRPAEMASRVTQIRGSDTRAESRTINRRVTTTPRDSRDSYLLSSHEAVHPGVSDRVSHIHQYLTNRDVVRTSRPMATHHVSYGTKSRVTQYGGRTVREGLGRHAQTQPKWQGGSPGVILGGKSTGMTNAEKEAAVREAQQRELDSKSLLSKSPSDSLNSSCSGSGTIGDLGNALISEPTFATSFSTAPESHRRHHSANTPRQGRSSQAPTRSSSISYIRNAPATGLQGNESLVAPSPQATPSRVTIMNGNVVQVFSLQKDERRSSFKLEVHTIWN